MKNSQFLNSIIFLTGALVSTSATAQVYKCTSVDHQSNKQYIVYTDSPCAERVKQTLINVKTRPVNLTAMSDETPLDGKITRAVIRQDFRLAKSLATTKAHWRLISMAEGAHQHSVKTVPIVAQQAAARDECAYARNAYESVARNRWRDKELIAIKKSTMFAACGVAEPSEQSRAVLIGNRYNGRGIQSRRWVARPYSPMFYPQAHYKKHNNQHVNRGGSISIKHKSEHFRIRAQSGGVQTNTDIRQQFRTKNFAAEQHTDIRQQFR